MQCFLNGPDIPNRLLQAHEDGQMVFYCCAWISFHRKIPLFEGLVSQLYDMCGVNIEGVFEQHIENYEYDAAIGALERKYVGDCEGLRKKLHGLLQADLESDGSLHTHQALLRQRIF